MTSRINKINRMKRARNSSLKRNVRVNRRLARLL